MSVILCSFEEILDYLGHLKRPLVEGMRLHDSHHILEVGLIEFNRWVVKILGLVLQTSELKGKPHEVIIAKYLESKELLGTCSCKTGSGKCKHIIGVMLKHIFGGAKCNENAMSLETSSGLQESSGSSTGDPFDTKSKKTIDKRKKLKLAMKNKKSDRATKSDRSKTSVSSSTTAESTSVDIKVVKKKKWYKFWK